VPLYVSVTVSLHLLIESYLNEPFHRKTN